MVHTVLHMWDARFEIKHKPWLIYGWDEWYNAHASCLICFRAQAPTINIETQRIAATARAEII